MLYLICEEVLEEKYFTTDRDKSLICRVSIKAEMTLCMFAELCIISIRICSNDFYTVLPCNSFFIKVFFYCLDFHSQTFPIHRAAGESRALARKLQLGLSGPSWESKR